MLMGSLDSLASVGLQKRHLQQQREQSQAQQAHQNAMLTELIRQHLAGESLDKDKLSEEVTHHGATEDQQQQSLEELVKSRLADQDYKDRHLAQQGDYQNRSLDELVNSRTADQDYRNRHLKQQGEYQNSVLGETAAHHAEIERATDERNKALQSHYAATEAGQALSRELASKKNQNDQLHKTLSWLSDGVKHGAIKADVANQQLSGIAKTVPPDALAALQATPLGSAILSGQPLFQDVPLKAAGNAATANMKDSQYEQQLGDELMGAMTVGDSDTPDLAKRVDDFKALNHRKATGNIPYDTKTTTTVPDMNNPFNKVATTEHVRPGLPQPGQPTAAPATPARQSGPYLIKNKAEYDQLPSGTKFIDAQGKNWVKP